MLERACLPCQMSDPMNDIIEEDHASASADAYPTSHQQHHQLWLISCLRLLRLWWSGTCVFWRSESTTQAPLWRSAGCLVWFTRNVQCSPAM